ncbi:membrane protein UL124 [Cercopithecine betaherpesvirus 5]|uniref:Membrane protein UL124 n=1 Tax=Simian cytomegalovirus (strain Colburn) TaxID=50292 RepID=G8XTH8_SCMVC|nr:membrane protein UL124 [Cercopithecine betaherpesvirus 5]AEV80470.1 membrane protein UL124 [Cercopithecine betaherpesvirus 5]
MKNRLSICCLCLSLVAHLNQATRGTVSEDNDNINGIGPLTSSAMGLNTQPPGSVMALAVHTASSSPSSAVLPTVLALSGMVLVVLLMIGLNISSTFWSQEVDEDALDTATTPVEVYTVDLCVKTV